MMEYFRRTAFQIICLTTTASAAVSADESPTDLFVRKIRDVDEEETEFEGDVALADEDERELDLIFAETLRGSGRKRDQDKKARKQKNEEDQTRSQDVEICPTRTTLPRLVGIWLLLLRGCQVRHSHARRRKSNWPNRPGVSNTYRLSEVFRIRLRTFA